MSLDVLLPPPFSLSAPPPDNIEEAERQWKLEFHLWSAYMMHWKSQFDHYNKQDRCSEL